MASMIQNAQTQQYTNITYFNFKNVHS